MSSWSRAEFEDLAAAEEVDVASRRVDGSLSPRVTIWIVAHDGTLYLRSWKGPERPWYRAARERGRGRIWGASRERDVAFERADPDVDGAVDEAFREKYGRRHGSYVADMVTAPARETTLRVLPR